MTFLDQLITAIQYMVFLSILSHVVGEALPRRWFRWDHPPYAPFSWEHGGRFYEKLGIRKWKDRLPDKSRYTRRTFTKQIQGHTDPDSLVRFLQETCIAEAVHWTLALLSFPIYSRVPTPFGIFATVMFFVGNIPFIMIQRYNRPRLLRLLERTIAS